MNKIKDQYADDPKVIVISVTEARTKLTALIEEEVVAKGKRLILTKHWKPVAQVVPPDYVTPFFGAGEGPKYPTEIKGEWVEKPAKAKKSGTGTKKVGHTPWAEIRRETDLDRTKAAQKARDDLLRGVNRKS